MATLGSPAPSPEVSMSRLRSVRLRGQLLGLAGILIAVTILVGWIALTRLGTVRDAGRHVATVTQPAGAAVAMQRIDSEAVRRREYELATVAADDRADTAGEIRDGLAKIEKDFAAYERDFSRGEEDRDAMRQVHAAWAAYVTASAPAVAAALAGDQRSALAGLTTADEQYTSYEEASDRWRAMS